MAVDGLRGNKQKVTNTISDLKAVTCTFDNLQMISPTKFQRGGHSATVTNTTSKMFSRVNEPEILNILSSKTHHNVKITYMDQNIVTPPLFPNFDIVDYNSCIGVLPQSLELQDCTGQILRNYHQLTQLNETLLKFKYWMNLEEKKKTNRLWNS